MLLLMKLFREDGCDSGYYSGSSLDSYESDDDDDDDENDNENKNKNEYKKYYKIDDKPEFIYRHKCKEYGKSHLDSKIYHMHYDRDKKVVKINSDCFCCCKEGIGYLFRILRMINQKKLMFGIYFVIILIISINLFI